MNTMTKQWLQQTIADMEEHRDLFPGDLDDNHENVLAALRIALASLEPEAVAYIRDGFRADGVHFCGGIITAEEHDRTKPALSDRYTWKHQPLYTAPPAPVSVPDYPETLPCPVMLEPGLRFGKGVPTKTMLGAMQRRAEHYAELEAMTPEQREEHDAGMKEFAAMLQGADQATVKQPSSNSVLGWLRADYQDDNRGLRGNAPLFVLGKKDPSTVWGLDYIPLTSNSPVIPDGWVLVPVEPTEAMINAYRDALYSGESAVSCIDLYKAMIAAAPQQDA
ncbi:TPA: hypothetical protein O8U20_003154 [Enterobacter cloacae]|nr:hypothetical protein [Enterobacter cloacae]